MDSSFTEQCLYKQCSIVSWMTKKKNALLSELIEDTMNKIKDRFRAGVREGK